MTLKDYLEESGITREKFAKKVGVSRQTIQAILAKRWGPGLSLAFAIEKATGGMVRAEELVTK